jgi:hypothetical protein
MANPKIGQPATLNGKKVVWSGQNYGWQSPASHTKLANDGKFRVGTQALDRISQSVSRAIPKPIKDYAKGVAQEGARQQASKDRVLQRAGVNTSKPDATTRTLDAASKASNVDRRIVGAAATAAQAAISSRALKGGAAKPTAATKPSTSTRATAPRPTAASVAPRPTSARPNTPRPNATRRQPATQGTPISQTSTRDLESLRRDFNSSLNVRGQNPNSARSQASMRRGLGEINQELNRRAGPGSSAALERRVARNDTNPTRSMPDPRGQRPQRPSTPQGDSSNRSVGAAARSDVAGKTSGRNIHRNAVPGTFDKKTRQPLREIVQRHNTKAGPRTLQGVPKSTKATAAQASGPITPKSDGRKLAKGNSLAKEKPVDFHAKEQLKEKAVAAHVKTQTYGATNSAKPKAGQDHRGFMPNGGRTTPRFNSTIKDKNGNSVKVSNTDNTILGKKEKFRQKLYSQIPDDVRGQARRTQQRQLDRQVTEYGKGLERQARADAVAFQKSQEIKGFKGSTPKSQQAMAEHMAGIPKKPVAKPKPSSNKGIPANPPTHSPRGQAARVVQPNKKGGPTTTISSRSETRRGLREAGGNGDLVTNNGRSRTVDPKTGRPGLMATQGTRSSARPSPTRTRGSNPAENFPQRSGRARMTGEFKNPAGGSPIKTEAANRFTPEEGSGLAVRRAGRTSGIRPVDGRGSSTPIRRQGSAKTDTKVKVTTKGKTRNVARAGTSKPTTGTVSNEQAARATRNAQNFKPSPRNAPKASDKAPTRSPARQAALKEASDKIRENIRRTRGLTAKQKADKIREATRDLQERVGKPSGFTSSGEVRLQGSSKGNRYQTGIESGTPDGRVGKTGPHDGQVSRVVGKNSADKGRTTQAAQQTKETLAKVRQRAANKAKAEAVLDNRSAKKLPGVRKTIKNGKPANTIKAKNKAVDRKGNNLDEISLNNLKALGWR